MKANAKEKIDSAVARANFLLRDDVLALIQKAYRKESEPKAKKALSWILENAASARDNSLAICQDTGYPIIFIEAGRSTTLNKEMIDKIRKYVEDAYSKNFLRPSLVDPLFRGTPSYRGVEVKIGFGRHKGLRVTIMPKGFGCENKTKLKMFNPTAGPGEIESFVVETVKSAGPEACPPFVVGVGIGGTSEGSLLLAKKALLENLKAPNEDKQLSSMEKRLLRKINSLKIGPMGLGGATTALAVKVKKQITHIAGLPVGVNISCHALRSATVSLEDLNCNGG
jgi:fumarate hydratase subunit alpha